VVRRESLLEWRDQAERPVPGYVEEELRGYLKCGILFAAFDHDLDFCRRFFRWHNEEHRHRGIGLLTPAVVHSGHADAAAPGLLIVTSVSRVRSSSASMSPRRQPLK